MYEIYVVIIVGLVCFLIGFAIGVYRESKDGQDGLLFVHMHSKTKEKAEAYCSFQSEPETFKDGQIIKLEVVKIDN